MRNLTDKTERRKRPTRSTIRYYVGDPVLVKSYRLSSPAVDQVIHEFFLLYEGPYIVCKKVAENAFSVQNHTGDMIKTYNVINFKKNYYEVSVTL